MAGLNGRQSHQWVVARGELPSVELLSSRGSDKSKLRKGKAAAEFLILEVTVAGLMLDCCNCKKKRYGMAKWHAFFCIASQSQSKPWFRQRAISDCQRVQERPSTFLDAC